MKRGWTVAAVLGLGLMLATTALAQGDPGWGRWGAGPGPCWMMGGFGPYGTIPNLTGEQITSFNNLQQVFVNDTANLRNELVQKRLEFQNLMVQVTPDAAAVTAKQKEVSDVMAKVAEKRTSYQLEARKLLTPEQVTQLPPGCTLGFGNVYGGPRYGAGQRYGAGMGFGRGSPAGPGYGRGWGRGRGYGRAPCWW